MIIRSLFLVFILLFSMNFQIYALENLGTYGKLYEIVEPDMYEWLMKKVKEINDNETDIKGKIVHSLRQSAVSKIHLMPALNERIRKIDVRYKAKENVSVNGQIIVKKGQVVDPLKSWRNTKFVYVVASEKYMRKAVDILKEKFPDYKDVVVMVSEGDVLSVRKKDFMKPFNDRIYTLPEMVKERFKLEFEPSFIYMCESVLCVHEIPYPGIK